MRIWSFLIRAVIICLFNCYALYAADFSAGALYLEINLATASSIQLHGMGKLRISETDGLMQRELELPITITVMNPEALSYYAVLADKPAGITTEEDTLAISRAYFDWEAGQLVIKREYQYFYPESFSNIEAAEAYARELGQKPNKVMELSLINSTVQIKSRDTTLYLETPLNIESHAQLQINGSKLGYQGDFKLKTKQRNLVLNQFLPLDDYIAGVIQNEIGNNAPAEALKAQAVAARTHAVSLLLNNRHKADGYDLCNGTHCQVYKGEYLSNPTILQAVHDTAGEVMFSGDSIADATYHSCCGGKTDASSAIWKGKPIEHLNGVTCIPEADTLDLSQEAIIRAWIDRKPDPEGMSSWERSALTWDNSITKTKVALNAGLSSLNRIEIISRGRSGRILSMKLYGDKTINLDNEYKIRQVFGNLLSSCFYIQGNYTSTNGIVSIVPRATLSLKGKGAGHGVGMCQVGALRMARRQAGYHEILQHYYPGTRISTKWMKHE